MHHLKDRIPVPAMINAVVLEGYRNLSWRKTEYNGSLSKRGVGFAAAFFLVRAWKQREEE